jgi:hypothetical protein
MHLTNCGNCSAFKIARDVAMKGNEMSKSNNSGRFYKALRANFKTPGEAMRRLGLDEALLKQPEEEASAKPNALLKGLLKLSADELANALPLLRRCLGGENAEDEGEGFGSSHEREVERMDDDRAKSPAMDAASRLAFDKQYPGAAKIRIDASQSPQARPPVKIDHAAVLAQLDRVK